MKIKSFNESRIEEESNDSAIAEVDSFIDQINLLREKFENTTYIHHDDELIECLDNLIYRAEDLKDELIENNIEL